MDKQKGLKHGVYKIHWCEGGSSLAAIGNTHDGTNWFSCCNWTHSDNQYPLVACTEWNMVNKIELLIPHIRFGEPLPPINAGVEERAKKYADKKYGEVGQYTTKEVRFEHEATIAAYIAGAQSSIPSHLVDQLRKENPWLSERAVHGSQGKGWDCCVDHLQSLLNDKRGGEDDSLLNILKEVEKIRFQSGVYIWAFPITYRDDQGKVEKITFGWELEWPTGKIVEYREECDTYKIALNEGIKAYQ